MQESIDDPVDISLDKFVYRTQGKRVFLVLDSKIAADLRKDKELFNSHMNETMNHMSQTIGAYMQEVKKGNKEAKLDLKEMLARSERINIGQLIGMKSLPFMVASVESSGMYEEMESVERFCFDGATYIAVPRHSRYSAQAWYAGGKGEGVEKALKQRFEVASRLQNWSPPSWMIEVDRDALIKRHGQGVSAPEPKVEP